MRQTTRRKTYGRSALAQALRSAVESLKVAIDDNERDPETPLVVHTKEAIAAMGRALYAFDIYGLDRKRMRAALEKIIDQAQELLTQVIALPITQDEKVLAKHSAGAAVLTPSSPANVNAAPPLVPTSTKEPSRAIKASGVPKTTPRRSSSGQARRKKARTAVQGKGKRASHVARSSSKRADSHPQRRKRAPAKKSGK